MADSTSFDKLSRQSSWYGTEAQRNRSLYVWLKGIQIFFAAAIPVVAVTGGGNVQRYTTAALGAVIGIVEGSIQLGQFQQNWLLYRATREALKREDLLHSGKAGPYSGAPDPDTLFVERCDAIVSGENLKWLATQEQATSTKGTGEAPA
jgi:hypothetical protein